MKDQVDNLEARGVLRRLPQPAQPDGAAGVLDKLRLGDLGLIFKSRRNGFRSTAFGNALMHREIGAWVFDEGALPVKWGPPRLSVRVTSSKAARRTGPRQCSALPRPPSPDRGGHLRAHFEKAPRRGAGAARRRGEHARTLSYEVRTVPGQAKYGEVLQLLQKALQEGRRRDRLLRGKDRGEVAAFLRRPASTAAISRWHDADRQAPGAGGFLPARCR